MAGFGRLGGAGGLGSFYPGANSLQQPMFRRDEGRRDDRRDDRYGGGGGGGRSNTNTRDTGFSPRAARDPSPRRRRYSPEPSFSSMRSRQDRRAGDLDRTPLPQLDRLSGGIRDDVGSSRGQNNYDTDRNRGAGLIGNMGPNLGGDGILGAKPGDMLSAASTSPNASAGIQAQLAQQQQQLMAMMQTQNLLAAFQAQAKQAGASLLPMGGGGPPGGPGRPGLMDRNRKRRMSPPRNGPVRKFGGPGGPGGPRNVTGYHQRNEGGGFRNNRNRPQQYPNRQRGGRNQQADRSRHHRDFGNKSKSNKKADSEPEEEPYVEDDLADEEEEEEKEDKKVEEKTGEKEEKDKTNEEKDASAAEKSTLNLAGQDIEKLVRSLFDSTRQKYVCKVCKILCNKEGSFRMHLQGKRHVKNWLENQGKSFEVEMFKRASQETTKTESTETKTKNEESESTTKEAPEETKEGSTSEKEATATIVKEEAKEEAKEGEEPKEASSEEASSSVKEEKDIKSPSPKPSSDKPAAKKRQLDIKYTCDTRKSAIKEDDVVTISSVTQARVRIAGFPSGENMHGCEFVKAVSGFNCRLCKTFILNGHDVMKHVRARKHQRNYAKYIIDHPNYEANQMNRNKDLADMLSEKEGEELLLYEVTEEEKRAPHRYYSADRPQVQVTKYMVDLPTTSTSKDHESQEEVTEKDQEPENKEAEETPQENQEAVEQTTEEEAEQDAEKTEEDEVKPAVQQPEDGYQSDNSDVIVEHNQEMKEQEETPTEDKNDSAVAPEEASTEAMETETDEKYDPTIPTDEDDEEPLPEDPEPEPVVVTPTGRRGRRGGRGNSQASGRGRGAGRGRGRGRRGRPKASPKTPTAAKTDVLEAATTPDGPNDDMDFMDGFEVIDEVADDE